MNTKNKALKGVNLGGWLMMEGYILRGRNIAESFFKKEFEKENGKKALLEFEKLFRDNFITKDDFRKIAAMGAKVIRLPFNHKVIEKKAGLFGDFGFYYLDRSFKWAKEFNLKIVLDLHAAAGAQNCDWHGDSCGKALLWEKASNKKRTYKLWEVVADRYKDNPVLYAYDVLNEPIVGERTPILREFYAELIKRIREIDKKSLIYLEGALWAQKIEFLKPLLADNIGVSIHTYQPLNYVFNFTPFMKYPGKIEGGLWNKKTLYRHLKQYHDFASKNKVKILVGEFGINWRGGHFGEAQWLDDMLDIFDDFGFDYTYWTYKAIANGVFPDGICSFIANNDFIKREGPLYGWENYIKNWKKRKKDIVKVWQTKNYSFTPEITNVLKKHFKK